MRNSDFIIDWINNLKKDINESNFKDDDIRKDFLGLLNDIAYCYYRPYLLIEISTLIHQKRINLDDFKNNKHIDAVRALIKNKTSYKSHFNSLNRQLIVDSWSAFELSTTTFCEKICDENELNKLLNTNYNEILKVLKKTKIEESESKKLIEKYVVANLTHIPIVRKTDFLFNKVKGYDRYIEKDKKFLIFYGKLRNCMHSNYIYYGKKFEYDFGNAKFIFENGELVKWYDPFNETPKLYFYLMGNLKDIWKSIINSIDYNQIIYYPNLEQQ
jgi:hypothetical protein